MSTYISYQVKIKDNPELLRIDAEDVDLMCSCLDREAGEYKCNHKRAWFNFTNDKEQTVAAIPYDQVIYIID